MTELAIRAPLLSSTPPRCRRYDPNLMYSIVSLAIAMKVVAASLENGLLSVEIVREIPEELKPRRINIGPGDAMAVSKQIIQDVEKPRKVA